MKRMFFLAFLIFIFQNAQAEEQKLSEAYEQQLVERVKSVFSSEAPKEEVERPVCATPIFLEVKANWDRLSARTRKILKSYVERPSYNFTEYVYDTPEGHFKIHYVREGDNAVFNPDGDLNVNGHPDWVDTVGMVLEHVWDTELNVLGYNQPPSDGDYPDTEDNGGDGKYDIYLLNIAYLGYTQGEFIVASPYPGSATSFIALDNDYLEHTQHSQLEWVQVTSAHEFFHAIQMGYDGTEYEREDKLAKPYWMEMSAVWMEDMVYDGVNDYLGYLSYFFNHPDWSLKTFSYEMIMPDSALHPYGSCVWPIYLTERSYPSIPAGFDATIIRDIWEECAKVPGSNAIDYPGGESATDKALQARGITFEEAFREFTVWNYFTGTRTRTQLFYSEGDMFPEVKVEDLHYHTTYPVYSPSGPNHPYGLGSNYIVFKPEEKQGGIKLTFSPADEDYDFEISALGYNKDVNEPVSHEFQINHQTGASETDVYDWTSYNEIIMIPAAASRDGDSFFPYIYSAVFDSSYHGEYPFPQKDWIGQNFPNPFVIESSSDSTYFPFILSSVSEVKIDVFTVSGELIWDYPPPKEEGEEWTIGDYTKRGRCPAWDGRNQKGEYVASGIYIYQVRTKNSTVIKKIAVIR